jgi:hypothetical protein
MRHRNILAFLLVTAVMAVPSSGAAQSTADLARAQAQLRHEPAVAEITRMCLRYFRVDPENFDGLRRTAKTRALLPLIATGYRYDDDRMARFEQQEMFQPRTNDEDTNTRIHAFTVGGVWDLRELVFNPAEVQVYGLIGVQRDLMLEVTRTFYLRRQLQLRLLLRPPEDPLARAALEMRIDEYTSILDVLTDGWFSEETLRRREERRQRRRPRQRRRR